MVLHAPRGVDQHDIHPFPGGTSNRRGRDLGGILAVPERMQGKAQSPAVDLELLHSPASESVTRRDEYFKPVLGEEKRELGKGGGLPYPVHPTQAHDIGTGGGGRGNRLTGSCDVPYQVNLFLRGEYTSQRLFKLALDHLGEAVEVSHASALETFGDGGGEPIRDLHCDVFGDEFIPQEWEDGVDLCLPERTFPSESSGEESRRPRPCRLFYSFLACPTSLTPPGRPLLGGPVVKVG